MAKEFEVNLSQLRTDIDNARQNLNYIQTNLKSMFAELKELDATWDGEANEAFNVQINTDHEFMQEVCKSLNSLIDSMDNARNEYKKSESNVSSAIRALRF